MLDIQVINNHSKTTSAVSWVLANLCDQLCMTLLEVGTSRPKPALAKRRKLHVADGFKYRHNRLHRTMLACMANYLGGNGTR